MARGRFEVHFACECGSTVAYSGLSLDPTRGVIAAEIQRHADLGHQACTPDEARRIRNSEPRSAYVQARYPKRKAVPGVSVRLPSPGAGRAVRQHLVALRDDGEPSGRTVCGRPIPEDGDQSDRKADCQVCERRRA